MNLYIAERLESMRQILMATYFGGMSMSSSSKGTEREIFINNFLQNAFSPSLRFGTGDITDAQGQRSGQVDIVIESPLTIAFPTTGGVRLYLTECVIAIIEVKSDLSRQWEELERTTENVKKLRGEFHGGNRGSIPVYVVGYTGYQTSKGLEGKYFATPEEKRPDGILVLESSIYITPKHAGIPAPPWIFEGPDALMKLLFNIYYNYKFHLYPNVAANLGQYL